MSIDEQFARILRDAAELAPDPPGDLLALRAQRLGQRQRLRRRAALTGGAALLVLGCTAAATLLVPGRAAPSGGPGRVDGAFVVNTLTALLPPGKTKVTHVSGPSDPVPGFPTINLDLDDGHGAGSVNLAIQRVELPITDATRGTRCPDTFSTPLESCQRTVRPDGSVLVVWKEFPRGPSRPKAWAAFYTGADGRQVQAYAYNDAHSGAVTRDNPPVDLAQLSAITASSAWDPVFRAMPGTPMPFDRWPTTPTPSAVLATTADLLPAGATHDEGGEEHAPPGAHLTVTLDGRTSTISVEVEPHWTVGTLENGQAWGTAQNPRQMFEAGVSKGDLSHTADGSSVISHEVDPGNGIPGVTGPRRTVNVLLSNGTQVMVREWNGPTSYEDRPGPLALTQEQLQAIALSPAWRR